MASPPLVPYVQASQEWVHALILFGQLNGTEWAIMSLVMLQTWARPGRPTDAEIGQSRFIAHTGKSKNTVGAALKRLSQPVDRGGFNMLRKTRDHDSSAGTRWAIQDDWAAWAWPTPEAKTRARSILGRYEAMRSKDEANEPSEVAQELAEHLRTHCRRIAGPTAEVPKDGTRRWSRWSITMDKLLERMAEAGGAIDVHARLVRSIIDWSGGQPFWASKIVGMNADTALARNFDAMHVQAKGRVR